MSFLNKVFRVIEEDEELLSQFPEFVKGAEFKVCESTRSCSMKNSFELISTDPVKFNTWSIKSKLIIIIRKLMIDNKWSQSEAAEKLGISQPRVSNMLNGKLDKFSVDTLLEMVFKMGYKLDMDFTPLNTESPLTMVVKKAMV